MTMPSRNTFPALSAKPSATTPRVKTKGWPTWKSKTPTLHNRPTYNICWADQFVSQISIDQRSGGEPPVETKPRMKDVDDPTKLSRADYFRKFFPTRWGKQHLLPATNKNLKNNGHTETYWEEIEGWLGLWVMMSLNPSYNVDDFFTTKTRDEFWNPPYLWNHMSGNRFHQIERACV